MLFLLLMSFTACEININVGDDDDNVGFVPTQIKLPADAGVSIASKGILYLTSAPKPSYCIFDNEDDFARAFNTDEVRKLVDFGCENVLVAYSVTRGAVDTVESQLLRVHDDYELVVDVKLNSVSSVIGTWCVAYTVSPDVDHDDVELTVSEFYSEAQNPEEVHRPRGVAK